jgi:CRP-like cAMP-binding protein
MDYSTPLGTNRLLRRIAADDFARLQPHLKRVRLALGRVLHPLGAAIEHVYFPVSGMISLLAVMRSGDQIETGVIGRDGVAGASVAIDGWTSGARATVQIEGVAWQIPAGDFLAIYRTSEGFRSLINRYLGIVLFQAQQSAACNAIHPLEARLCRWMLHVQDTVQEDVIALTQELLSHMLGVRRTSVSLCAHALQKSGLIRYARGKIKIVDRAGLQDSACECYANIRDYVEKVIPSGQERQVGASSASNDR